MVRRNLIRISVVQRVFFRAFGWWHGAPSEKKTRVDNKMQATVFSKSGWTTRLDVEPILPFDLTSFDMAAIKVLLQLHCWMRRRTWFGIIVERPPHHFHRRRSRGGPVGRHDRIRHCMEQGALSNMDHSHHCELMRGCRDWGSLLHDGMACSRSRAGSGTSFIRRIARQTAPSLN